MKTRILNFTKAILCVVFLSLAGQLSASSIDGNGNIVTQNYEITSFDEVSVALPATVNFMVSDEYSCTVRVDENILEYLDIRVEEEKLKMNVSKNVQSVDLNPTEFVIEISAPTLKEVKVSSSGDFVFLTSFSADKLEVKLSGSGNAIFSKKATVTEMELKIAGSGGADCQMVKSNKVEIDIAGSGDIHVGGGTVTKMDVSIAGSGSLESYCDVSEMHVKILGSGNVTANVGTNLFYQIAGSGNIYYYGTPNLKGKKVGSGVLQQLED